MPLKAPRPIPPPERLIAVVGCDPAAPGGISQVIGLLLGSSPLQAWPLRMVPTWVSGPALARARAFILALAQIWSWAATGRLQAVHLHMAARGSFWRKWLLSAPLKAAGVVVIVHIHDGTLPAWYATHPRWIQALFAAFLVRADAVIALSPSWVRTLKPVAADANWRVIGNPVAIAEYVTPVDRVDPLEPVERVPGDATDSPGAADKPNASGALVSPNRYRRALPPCAFSADEPDAPARILFLGRLRSDKGLHDLLEAAALLRPRFPRWSWTLAGDGDLDSLAHQVSQLSLEGVVHFPGWLNECDKRCELARADLFVLPSHAEGQSLAILEAMAWALPVVATDVGDASGLLKEDAGRLVPVGDHQALAHAVRSVLSDRQAARQMGQRGRARVMRQHAVAHVARQHDALYRELGLRPRYQPPQGTQAVEA